MNSAKNVSIEAIAQNYLSKNNTDADNKKEDSIRNIYNIICKKVSELESINGNDKMIEYAGNVFKLVINDDYVLQELNNLKEYDEYTHNHSINVAVLSFLLGFSRGYEIEDLTSITKGALLHDIGKSKIPENILNKPGKLTPEEFNVIMNHSALGYDIIKDGSIPELSKKIILYHHTRLDGSGYPKLADGDTLNEAIQIVSLCDVFDALTADRVYKQGMPKMAAYRLILSEMSSGLNVDLLNCLMELFNTETK